MQKLSHNKRRTAGLVYEFLSRTVTEAVVARDRLRAADAMDIMSRYMADGTALHGEVSLHRQVIESRGVSERLARRIVDELKASGIRMSARASLMEQAKTDMIHEINRKLGRDVFDRFRIPDYTAHASIGIIMSRGLSGRIDEGVELARVEDHLIEFLIGTPVATQKFDRDASLYAYKTAVGLFEGQFGQELSWAQAELLREYVRVSLGGNKAPFERTFERQRAELREVLRARRADDVFTADNDMSARLTEAISELDSMSSDPDDELVEKLLLFHNLRQEIES